MQSSDIRWILAGLFVAFLVVVALSDLIRRKPSSRNKPSSRKSHQGFRDIKHGDHLDRHHGWKGK